MSELLALLLERTPFLDVDDARRYMEWYEDAESRTAWDNQCADWATAIIVTAETP